MGKCKIKLKRGFAGLNMRKRLSFTGCLLTVAMSLVASRGSAEAADSGPGPKPAPLAPKADETPDLLEQGKVDLAEKLYQEGQELVEQRQFDAACKKLKKSAALDPQLRTRFALANCYVEIGKLATAQNLYIEIATAADAQKNAKGANTARQKALELAPEIPYIVINASEQVHTLPFLQVKLDNMSIPNDWLGSGRNPVDLGPHTIIVEAEGKRAFVKTVLITHRGQAERVVVAALEDTAVVASPKPKPRSWLRTGVGIALLVGGAGALLGGGYVGYETITQSPSAQQNAPIHPFWGGVLFTLGFAGTIGGVFVLAGAKDKSPPNQGFWLLPQATPSYAGALMVKTF